jgi:hypothetical protein
MGINVECSGRQVLEAANVCAWLSIFQQHQDFAAEQLKSMIPTSMSILRYTYLTFWLTSGELM